MNRRRSFLAGPADVCFAAPSVVRVQQLVHLTVGDPPSDPGITPVVGISTGIYRRYGIDLTIQVMATGAATSAAVAGGALQVGGSSLMGLIDAHVGGIPFQIVAPASVYVSDRAAEALVVRKDAPIRSAADLTGKTVASPALGDLLSTATMAWIDANGGNAKLVHQVELPPSATAAALESGGLSRSPRAIQRKDQDDSGLRLHGDGAAEVAHLGVEERAPLGVHHAFAGGHHLSR
jgi:ABC-type nitrate/sulfonate/bicarbonate transport system substrate-binding protein